MVSDLGNIDKAVGREKVTLPVLRDDGREFEYEFMTKLCWAMPIKWHELCAAIETHGLTSPTISAAYRCFQVKAKGTNQARLNDDCADVIFGFVRREEMYEQRREWKKADKCLRDTCGHHEHDDAHMQRHNERRDKIKHMLMGPNEPEWDSMDFLQWQKRFMTDFQLWPHIAKKADKSQLSYYDPRIAIKNPTRHDYFGYLLLPVKGIPRDLRVCTPYDLMHYKTVEEPQPQPTVIPVEPEPKRRGRKRKRVVSPSPYEEQWKKATWKIHKHIHQRKFRRVKNQFGIKQDEHYRGPVNEVMSTHHNQMGVIGDLRDDSDEEDEGNESDNSTAVSENRDAGEEDEQDEGGETNEEAAQDEEIAENEENAEHEETAEEVEARVNAEIEARKKEEEEEDQRQKEEEEKRKKEEARKKATDCEGRVPWWAMLIHFGDHIWDSGVRRL